MRLLAGLVLALMLPACGKAGEAKAAGHDTDQAPLPVGIWEHRYADAVGQTYRDVMDLRADGSYVVHASGWMADRGHYTLQDGKLSLESDTDQRHTVTVDVDFQKGHMTTSFVPPGFEAQAQYFRKTDEWTRVTVPPNFPIVEIDGRAVPAGLPSVMASALRTIAEPWQADALPVSVEVDELPNRNFEVDFRFYSPSAFEGMDVRMTAYDLKTSKFDQSKPDAAPLPPDFLDLPRVIADAKESGVKGPLKRASLRLYDTYGAVWGLSTVAEGAWIDAASGERIHDDVTGYIAAYNAQWDQINQQWRAMFRGHSARPHGFSSASSSGDSGTSYDDGGGSGADEPDYSTGLQGSWENGDWDAYDRYQSGAPNDDDCYNYGC